MSFVIMVHYEVEPSAVEQVATNLRRMIEPSRAEPGNLAYIVGQSPTDPTSFSLYEEYADQAAFDAHTETEHFRVLVLEGVRPLVVSRVRHDLVRLDPL